MAMVQATGVQIVRVSGGIATHVGIYDASDIDLDIARNTPNSNPEEAFAWIMALLTGAGILMPSTSQEHHATLAQRWYSWLYFWEISHHSEACPDECKDPDTYEAKRRFVQQQLCKHLTAIGLTYPLICNQPVGVYLESNVTKF